MKIFGEKAAICAEIDSNAGELIELSHLIHENPELSGMERMAARLQAELYERHGFEVASPYGGLATSFSAKKKGKGPGPVIAFLSEYDALPEIGHACGHNIIAASAAGALIGVAAVIGRLDGEARVIGCPEEESGGGKIKLLDAGAFDGVGYVMETHASNRNIVSRGSVACASVTVEYFGKSAHSSAPYEGVNALSSLILLFNHVDLLRQTWNSWWIPRASGIIVDGGSASNVIPSHAKGIFLLRADRHEHLLSMIGDLTRVAEAAAVAVGTTFATEVSEKYAEIIPNIAMGERFASNMEMLGEKMNRPRLDERKGSSDIGNVSQVVPTIHEYIQILFTDDISHTIAFRDAAVSKRGDLAVLLAAKGMAMTAYDILTDSSLRSDINAEFRAKTSHGG
jgi:amidohydrolase